MSAVTWRGVFPAVTTQFRADQSIDLEATGRHIEALLKAGVLPQLDAERLTLMTGCRTGQ